MRFSPNYLAKHCESIGGDCTMKKSFAIVIVIVATIFLLTSTSWPFAGNNISAKRVTLVGEVNDNNQVVANNQIYEVNDNKVGDDLVKNYIAMKVKVIGKLIEKDDMKIITVESFEVVGE
jgi:hypothetical protein